jgi:hypothetical protein
MQKHWLPAEIRAKFKKARDHADVALGLQDALMRKKLGGPAPIPQSGGRPLPPGVQMPAETSQPGHMPPSKKPAT